MPAGKIMMVTVVAKGYQMIIIMGTVVTVVTSLDRVSNSPLGLS